MKVTLSRGGTTPLPGKEAVNNLVSMAAMPFDLNLMVNTMKWQWP